MNLAPWPGAPSVRRVTVTSLPAEVGGRAP